MNALENVSTLANVPAVASKGPSKSDFIRDCLKRGIAKPSEIVQTIQKERGIEVNPGLVNAIKFHQNHAQGKVNRVDKNSNDDAPVKKTRQNVGQNGRRGNVRGGANSVEFAQNLYTLMRVTPLLGGAAQVKAILDATNGS